MNHAEAERRNEMIATMFANHVPQVEIARVVNLNPPRVRAILQARGALKAQRPVPRVTTTAWDFDDNHRLRMAIWKRAKHGAKEALGR